MNMTFIPEKKFMQEAIALAKKSASIGEIPVGAVVELNGEIIGRGYNSRETLNDPLGHAEIMAVRSAAEKVSSWRLDNASLYVTLEPCPMCAGAAVNSRISRIVFGAEDPTMGACGTVIGVTNMKNSAKCEIFRNFMEDECRELLRDFFLRMRKRPL